MRTRTVLCAVVLGSCAAAALAQSQTQKKAPAAPATVVGEVVRYEPGKVIVIKTVKKEEVPYPLVEGLKVPSGVGFGSSVTLYTEPGEGGVETVKRVVINSVTPTGEVRRLTEEIRTKPTGAVEMARTFALVGTVTAYEPGKSITVTAKDGTETTYAINHSSRVPAGLKTGSRVTVYPSAGQSAGDQTVQRVVYTKKAKSKKTS